MKYLILIHGNPAVGELFAAMTDDERRAAFQIYWDVESDLQASGELIDSKALDDSTQKTITRGASLPASTAVRNRLMFSQPPI